ncbi:unnamed protein product [Heterobilharzia americana]|nr:unnamed protein product [Heterobilharzia americana]
MIKSAARQHLYETFLKVSRKQISAFKEILAVCAVRYSDKRANGLQCSCSWFFKVDQVSERYHCKTRSNPHDVKRLTHRRGAWLAPLANGEESLLRVVDFPVFNERHSSKVVIR